MEGSREERSLDCLIQAIKEMYAGDTTSMCLLTEHIQETVL